MYDLISLFSFKFKKIDENSKEHILFRNKKTKKVKYSKIYPLDENECDKFNCPICLDSLIFRRVVLKTECNHVFHKSCLDDWILCQKLNEKKPECPICRKKFNLKNLAFIIT